MGSSRESRAPIQGSRRPAASLKAKDSGGMIGKPAVSPRRSPLIIYVKSPEIIHTKARDFMALVQRLTGRSPTPPPPSSSSPSPARQPSSSAAPDMEATPQAPPSACFAPLALDGTASTNLGIPQQMTPISNVDAFFGDDVLIDAKPYAAGAVLCATSPAAQNLQYFRSSTTAYADSVEISSPPIASAPTSEEITPFMSMLTPWASVPPINRASSSFDIDFTSPTGLHSL